MRREETEISHDAAITEKRREAADKRIRLEIPQFIKKASRSTMRDIWEGGGVGNLLTNICLASFSFFSF
jgi:hypothetical protein